MDRPQVCALVENLTPNILKLDLGGRQVEDKHVTTLVQRCKKIKELKLSHPSITNDSVNMIVKNLNSLEYLDLSYNKIGVATLLQLKSVPTLKTLHFEGENEEYEEIKNLKLQLPRISINQPEGSFVIADSRKIVNGYFDDDRIWEIRANRQDLFPRADLM